ncbi:hypothetical protein CLOM_g2917 [Closterium sp. NIES-68]|nr:hypothetical protein CLOM_g2917 [Closterium sp. NIES-68]GJP71242.1 hypothetical protein CLOP_g2096 [Closterium sp. NIES-67]GJP79068.1 hypothetical protein CLOP_g9313 [Closterium sp. NIES-67]
MDRTATCGPRCCKLSWDYAAEPVAPADGIACAQGSVACCETGVPCVDQHLGCSHGLGSAACCDRSLLASSAKPFSLARLLSKGFHSKGVASGAARIFLWWLVLVVIAAALTAKIFFSGLPLDCMAHAPLDSPQPAPLPAWEESAVQNSVYAPDTLPLRQFLLRRTAQWDDGRGFAAPWGLWGCHFGGTSGARTQIYRELGLGAVVVRTKAEAAEDSDVGDGRKEGRGSEWEERAEGAEAEGLRRANDAAGNEDRGTGEQEQEEGTRARERGNRSGRDAGNETGIRKGKYDGTLDVKAKRRESARVQEGGDGGEDSEALDEAAAVESAEPAAAAEETDGTITAETKPAEVTAEASAAEEETAAEPEAATTEESATAEEAGAAEVAAEEAPEQRTSSHATHASRTSDPLASSVQPQPSQPSPASQGGVDIFFQGEFGYELIAVLPSAYWHYLNGSLRSTTSCGRHSLASLYYFSPNHTDDATCQRDDMKDNVAAYGFRNGIHYSHIPPAWQPPTLAAHFRKLPPVWPEIPEGSRLVVIGNKFEREWGHSPVNFIDIRTLLRIVDSYLEAGFYVVYNNPGMSLEQDQRQKIRDGKDLGDYEALQERFGKNRRLQIMQNLQKRWPGLSFNDVQFRMMARSVCFVSVQGGGSIVESFFGGRNIIFFREGQEVNGGAYKRIYPRLSGANVKVVTSYGGLVRKVDGMTKKHNCYAQLD